MEKYQIVLFCLLEVLYAGFKNAVRHFERHFKSQENDINCKIKKNYGFGSTNQCFCLGKHVFSEIDSRGGR